LYHLATDDDPRAHPFQFPALAGLGDFGRALRGALDMDVARRPSARDLQHQFELLLIPATTRPLQAPDGSDLPDVAALAQWCERHWRDGAAWLYGKLPDQVELWWGQSRLARELREIVDQQRGQAAAGLDAALALLDPAGFGAAQPQLDVDQASLQFGTLRGGAPGSATVTFSNPGPRLARADVRPPPWIASRHRSSALAPGSTVQITFLAAPSRAARGRQRAEIVLGDGAAALARIEAQATFARWPIPWRHVLFAAVAIALVAELFWIVRPTARIPPQPAIALDSPAGQAILAQQRERALADARASGDLVAAIESGKQEVLGLAFGAGGRTLLALSKDGRLKSWATADARALLDSQATTRDVMSQSFSSDGRLVAIGSYTGIIYVRSTAGGELLLTLDAFNSSVEALAFSRDGLRLVAVSHDGQSAVWRVSDGALFARTDGPQRLVSAAAISSDARVIAVLSGADGQLELRRADDGVVILGGPQAGQVQKFAFSPNGRALAVVDYSQGVLVWNADANAQIRLPACNTSLSSLAFSSGGDVLACGAYDGSIKLWRLHAGAAAEIKTLRSAPDRVTSLAFGSGDQTLVSGDAHGTIMIWKVAGAAGT
jgi:hypothetical protein